MVNPLLLQMIIRNIGHSSSSTVDRVWGNIWLVDDMVYSDSYGNGQIIHPQDGGTNNVLSLIAGEV